MFRERDEKLDVIVLCAQALVSRFRQINGLMKERGRGAIDSLQIASLLAIFVSDHFGGSDKSAALQNTRKAVSGSNYRKPFVCTCPTGNDDRTKRTTKDSLDGEDIVFLDLCERALQSLKARRNSVVVPIGSLQFGVCRHRALLMKVLLRMEFSFSYYYNLMDFPYSSTVCVFSYFQTKKISCLCTAVPL